MPITHGYSTLSDLEARTVEAIDPVPMERLIEAASRAIDQYCQRHFWQVTEARTFPAPRDMRTLHLGEYNDLSAAPTSVKTDAAGDGTFETTWSTSDYELLPTNTVGAPEPRPYTTIRATGLGQSFPSPTCTGRTARVEVTGTWGWAAVPASVHQACLILATRLLKRKDSPEGISGWTDLGVMRLARQDPDFVTLLDPYRRSAVLVA